MAKIMHTGLPFIHLVYTVCREHAELLAYLQFAKMMHCARLKNCLTKNSILNLFVMAYSVKVSFKLRLVFACMILF
jgi:hypothetical protein